MLNATFAAALKPGKYKYEWFRLAEKDAVKVFISEVCLIIYKRDFIMLIRMMCLVMIDVFNIEK